MSYFFPPDVGFGIAMKDEVDRVVLDFSKDSVDTAIAFDAIAAFFIL